MVDIKFIPTAHAYKKEETAVPLIAGSDQTGQEKNKLSIAFAKAGIIQAAPCALTALELPFKLHLCWG